MDGTGTVGRRAWAVEPLVRPLRVPGGTARSRWGFDPVLECYWAEVWCPGDTDVPGVRIGTDHLITTITGLARALAGASGLGPDQTFLALTS